MGLILGNAELKEGPITLRGTHAIISSEIEPLLQPSRDESQKLVDTVSEAMLRGETKARG